MVKGSGFTITSGMLVSECRLCKIGEFLPSAFNKDLFKSSYVCSLDLRLVGVVVLTGADMITLGYLKHMYELKADEVAIRLLPHFFVLFSISHPSIIL